MIIICVSSSNADPNAISRNLLKSSLPLRLHPSDIFEGIETAARLIWLTIPYFSLSGNEF